ncbi:MAG TPA: hypothetical protein VFP65_26745 [Anaeromyxobacteraceae bacterium]|nr:hypothetical protein [Anaeromyxobacteraceae bacterium]
MTWSTPSFEEIKMDAEARGYAGWPESTEPSSEEEAPAAETADRG